MTLTDDAKTAVALTTRLGSPQRPSLTAKMWHQFERTIRDAGFSPADVFDTDVDLDTVPGIGDELVHRIGQLKTDAGAAILEVDDLRHRGIWTTTMFDDGYPSRLGGRLGDNAPPVLFGCGDITLLTTPGIGIVGSRNVDEQGAEVAKELARMAVSTGLPVVSGGARGVDQLAMNAAFTSQGSVVGVLADSLVDRIRKPDMLEALDQGRICLLTQQAPSSGFTPAAAMARNKIVYALSSITVVVASDTESGGTWAGAVEALKAGNGVVGVWRGPGEGEGNATLEDMGAHPVREPSDLMALMGAPASSEQMTLELP